jgi:hypothetical protein
MNTLIKSIEEWVDQRVFANNEYFVTKFKEMEEIHIRDSNRIALLESRVQLYLDSPSPKADAGEAMHEADQILSELVDRVDDMDSRLDDVESSLEDKIDTCDADQMVDIAVNDIDVESRIIDAVQSEINAIEFKVTVER